MSDQRRPDDRELEEFLAGNDPLSRRYRQVVEREGPPDEIDQAVLARARQAIEIDLRNRRRRRLTVPLAMAATVVLTFSVFLVMREQPGGLPAPIVARDAPQEKQSTALSADAAREDDAAAANQAMNKAAEGQAAAIQEMEQRPAAPPAAPQAAAPLRTAPAPAPAGEASFQDRAAEPMAIGGAAERKAESAASVESTRAKARRARDERGGAPQAWLERIRALKGKGEVDEARKQLAAFRDANPALEIPEDLRSLLRPVTPPTP
jgi:hypothetical protein